MVPGDRSSANESAPLLTPVRKDGEEYSGFFSPKSIEAQFLFVCFRYLTIDPNDSDFRFLYGERAEKLLSDPDRGYLNKETVAENARIAKGNANTSWTRYMALTTVPVAQVLLILAWDALVLYTTQKGCECKANIRLWVKVHMVTLGTIIIRLAIYTLAISAGWRYANESIDELVSNWQPIEPDEKKGTQFQGQLLRAMQAKYNSGVCCRWLVRFYNLLISLVCVPLSLGGDVYGVFCLLWAFGACCHLLYITCLVVVIGDMLYTLLLWMSFWGFRQTASWYVKDRECSKSYFAKDSFP